MLPAVKNDSAWWGKQEIVNPRLDYIKRLGMIFWNIHLVFMIRFLYMYVLQEM